MVRSNMTWPYLICAGVSDNALSFPQLHLAILQKSCKRSSRRANDVYTRKMHEASLPDTSSERATVRPLMSVQSNIVLCDLPRLPCRRTVLLDLPPHDQLTSSQFLVQMH